jgi:Flp pilus assembly protein TadB
METLGIASHQIDALVAAGLVGSGLALAGIGLLLRNRTKQRTLAAILDDTMGQVAVPVEVVTEAPPRNETSALMVRLGSAVGRIDTRGHLEDELERSGIPLKAGEFLTTTVAFAVMLGVVLGVATGSPIGGVAGVLLVAVGAWKFPAWRAKKRAKKLQSQLPDALALMAAAVGGGQTFQRAIDMYRHDARAPLSEELDRVMAEVALGSDVVVALEKMADRSGIDDLKWAVEAVRIQQSTGGRLGPILHTLADFMRVRQEVRREVQTLSAEGRVSGYVLFALPIFMAIAISFLDPGYLKPMFHGIGLMVLFGTGGLMAIGYWIVRRMVNIEV